MERISVPCPCGEHRVDVAGTRLGPENSLVFWECPGCGWIRYTRLGAEEFSELAGVGVAFVPDGQEATYIEKVDSRWAILVSVREIQESLDLLEQQWLTPADLGCYPS